ncbi:Mitochodrial transcription termination factor-related protein [Artemisia annua]|uniref:Mitochodrial transcription termination factor-related protein n=1 Tax=Artemisia annua TaxID=35608 RepID=A0A2U1P9L1_ARTAN|nr:Mitochodrial transcription termination factor-related protein [Artemisia annua]
MINLSKVRNSLVLKRVFVNLAENHNPSTSTSFRPISRNPDKFRFYGRKASIGTKNGEKLIEEIEENNSFVEAQDALIDYLHSTSSLQYSDAENISRNSPEFLGKLLKGVQNEKDAKQSLRRLLCYHPINEFEPFFESMGLKPCEYSKLLPRNMMYLTDDKKLLANYHVFCEYGIASNKIGKIYMDAREVFRYEDGCLLSQLESLKAKGFSQASVAKLVASCPNVLVSEDFSKVLEALKNVGIASSWFEEHVLEENSYDWSKILQTFDLLTKFGLNNEDLEELLSKNPLILLEESGATTISLIVYLIKFGASVDDILSMFKQFPEIEIQNFLSNLKNGYHFLLAIDMDVEDAANIIRTHSAVLGSCVLKTVKSLLCALNLGKKRLCDIIKENPRELRNWVLGKKVKALPTLKEKVSQKRSQFLLNLGFVENSDEMSKALKVFRGNAEELQERFDCLVNAGLRPEDVKEMVKIAPQVINQSKEVIEMKIDYLVNDLGYNVSSLVAYPSFLGYSVQKIKFRFAVYNWLVERGKMNSNLALSTVLASSDRVFIRNRVDRDPEGWIVWNKFKKQFFPE